MVSTVLIEFSKVRGLAVRTITEEVKKKYPEFANVSSNDRREITNALTKTVDGLLQSHTKP